MTMRIHGDKIEFPDGTEQFTASSGGGSTPTPEEMVWEDKLSERVIGTEYTNEKDVPIYVQLSVKYSTSNAFSYFRINGVRSSLLGFGSGDDRTDYKTSLFIVPAKTTYQLETVVGGSVVVGNSDECEVKYWNEADMPLAIAVGGASSGGEAAPPMYAQTKLDANKSVSGGTEAFLNMHEELGNSGDFDTSGGNFRALKDGIYKFEYQVNVQSTTTGALETHYTFVKINDVASGVGNA